MRKTFLGAEIRTASHARHLSAYTATNLDGRAGLDHNACPSRPASGPLICCALPSANGPYFADCC